MQALTEANEKRRRTVGGLMGRNPHNRRYLDAQVAIDGTDAEIWALPAAATGAMHDSVGRLKFVSGLSDPTGDDVP